MDGILIIDKPPGMTSHDIVARVRRALGTKKVGHTGTLDPFATGVLVILVGHATRLAQFLDKDEKEYEATVRFGTSTDTGDLSGEPLISPDEYKLPLVSEIESALGQFRGDLEQVPPMYSAKKVDGRKLYEYARAGETIERKAVPINISTLEIVDGSAQLASTGRVSELDIRVASSAGTYIRVLAEDIGKVCSSGAHLSALRRTRAGQFVIENAVTLDELKAKAESGQVDLLPAGTAVAHLPAYILSAERVEKTRNGLSSRYLGDELADGQNVRMESEDGTLVAIGQFDGEEKVVQPKVVLG